MCLLYRVCSVKALCDMGSDVRVGGDASITALAINQPAEMAELKALSPMPEPEKGTTARGRDNYNALGWLRTKPGEYSPYL
jgi:hypothetical protein